MKQKSLQEQFSHIIENGTEADLEVLEVLLRGIIQKSSEKTTYINSFLGVETELREDAITMKIPLTPLTHNSLGIVHGGIIATLADTAMGTLANSMLGREFAAVTTEIGVHFLKEGTGSSLVCRGTVLHKGRTTLVLESKVYRDDGILCGHSTGSFYIIPRR
ncbi:PaaI family thioesterase [Peribacillus sp. SCS-37]|uniref:PaaI family thioesterase n=1 Tax=Paraperibacillus esterisolvens TaxID=3115296 RepID=UPI003905EAD9